MLGLSSYDSDGNPNPRTALEVKIHMFVGTYIGMPNITKRLVSVNLQIYPSILRNNFSV